MRLRLPPLSSHRRAALVLTAAALTVTATALPVRAQDAQGSTFGSTLDPESKSVQTLAEGDDRARRRGLDEIIVTAQKKEQDIREVPISVSAVSGEALKDQNIQDFSDLSKYTPNLTVVSGGVFNEVAIRGLGSGQLEGFEQSVGLIIDDVYYGRLHYLSMAFLDVKQIEVLRGPQGTLFGKNTIAGALTVRTEDPHEEYEASLTGEIGTYQKLAGTIVGNIPIIEDFVSVRIAATHSEREGFFYNSFLDMNDGRFTQDLVRGKVKFTFSDTAELVLTAVYNRYDTPQGAGFEIDRVGSGLGVLSEIFDPEFETRLDRQGSQDQQSKSLQINKDFTAKAKFELFDLSFDLIGHHSQFDRDNFVDGDFSPVPVIFLEELQLYDQSSLELRVAGDTNFGSWGDGEFIGGVYLFRSHLDADTNISVGKIDNLGGTLGLVLDDILNPIPLVGPLLLGILDTPNIGAPVEKRDGTLVQDTQSVAAFGQFTWHIRPWISVVAGMRISVERKEGSQFAQNFELGTIPSEGLLIQPILGAENINEDDLFRRESEFSPKLSVIWRATDNINVYATYARGFKSGGFNTQALTAEEIEFEPEQSDTYELGFKADFLDGVGRVNVGLFRTEFTDLQTFIFNGLAPIVENAAASVSQGVEIEGGAVLPWGFFLGGSASFLDAYYTEYENGPCQAGQSGFCDLTGERLGAPRYQLTVIVDYTTLLFDWPIELIVGGDLYFQGKQYLQADLDEFDSQDAYYRVNFRASLKSLDGWWSASVFLKNAFDKTIKIRGFDVPLFNGSHWARAGDPRTLIVQANVTF